MQWHGPWNTLEMIPPLSHVCLAAPTAIGPQSPFPGQVAAPPDGVLSSPHTFKEKNRIGNDAVNTDLVLTSPTVPVVVYPSGVTLV